MSEDNTRGGVRKKPDPMALATKGRVTTYETVTIAGVGTKVRNRGGKIVCRRK